MMTSFDEQKKSVLHHFERCRKRLSTRRRWNTLFSGLILVFTTWLLLTIAGYFLPVPFAETLSHAVLLLGTTWALAVTYGRNVDESSAAYVFDRLNQFDGAFLTWLASRHQTEQSGKTFRTALLSKIHASLEETVHVPDRAFPAGKAFACAGLLIVGSIAAQTTRHTQTAFVFDTKTANRTNDQPDPDSDARHDGDHVTTESDPSRSEEKRNRLMNRHGELKKQLAQSQKANESSGDLSRKRTRLKRDMNSFLNRKRDVRQDKSTDRNEAPSGGTPSTANESDKASERISRKPNRTGSGENEGTSSSTTSGERKSEGSDSKAVKNEDVQKVEQALRDLNRSNPVAQPYDGNRAANGNNREGKGKTELRSDVGYSPDSPPDGNPFDVEYDQIESALKHPPHVRDWSPKYDRSIERYRSFLSSFMKSEVNHDETQK